MLRLSLDKIKSIIKPEKAKDLLDKQHLDSSYSNFKFHYKEPSKAFLKDIDLIKKCKLTNTERSLIWLLFLDIIPFNNPSQWNKIISLARESYSKLRDKYITKEIETFIELKRAKDSILYDSYNTILKKEEFDLLNLIKIDVQRTYQEDEIFKLDIVKKKLVTVLYIYAKENLEAGYQQGMGDICGVFLYVLYKEFYLKSGFEKDELSSLYSLIHSNNVYLEYDLYLIFDKFMRKGIASFFLYNTSKYKENILGSKSIEEKLNLSLDDIINSNDSELKKRIYILYYINFKQFDPKFFDLLKNYVYPELFMLRWFLCVFTREFKLSQVVLIWDLIIMYEYVETHLLKKELLKTHLNFIEGAALSMIIHFKPFIIQKEDKNEILSGIMHFPEDISIDKICKKAIEVYLKLNPEISV
jgi:hypothetical protein